MFEKMKCKIFGHNWTGISNYSHEFIYPKCYEKYRCECRYTLLKCTRCGVIRNNSHFETFQDY